MRLQNRRLLILCLCMVHATALSAQWTHIGPWRGTVRAAVTFKGATFIGTDRAVTYRTTDGGATYEYLSGGLPQSSFENTGDVKGFRVIDGNLYVFLTNMAPHRWNDAKWMWERFIMSDDAADAVDMVKIGTSFFACRKSYLLEKSTARNRTLLMPVRNSHAIYHRESSVFVVGDTAIVRSDDTGTTWTTLPIPLYARDLRTCVVRDGMIVLVTMNGSICRSTDDGASWDTTGSGIPLGGVTRLMTDNGVYYAVDVLSRLYRSADCKTWRIIDHDSSPSDVNSIAIADNRIYAGTLTAGIHATDTSAATWRRSTEGLVGMRFASFSAAGTRMLSRVGKEIWEYDPVSGTGGILPPRSDTAQDGYLMADGCVYGDEEFVFDFRLHVSMTNADSVEHVMKVYNRATQTWTRKVASRVRWRGVYEDVVSSFHRNGIEYYTCFKNGSFRMSTDGGDRWLHLTAAGANCMMAGRKNVVFVSGDTYTGITPNRGGIWADVRWRPAANHVFFLDSAPAFFDGYRTLAYSVDLGSTFLFEEENFAGAEDMTGTLTDVFFLQSGFLKRYRGVPGTKSITVASQPPFTPKAIRSLNGMLYVQTDNGFYVQRLDAVSGGGEDVSPTADMAVYPQPVAGQAHLRVPAGTRDVRFYDSFGLRCDVPVVAGSDDNRVIRVEHLVSGMYMVVAEGAYGTRTLPLMVVK